MKISKNPKLVIDVDDTITINNSSDSYENKLPREDIIKKIIEYKEMGFEIILFTARNMFTHQGNLNKINEQTSPILIKWLEKHNIPYDQLIFGKPWCGLGGFYVDDKAIRPDEFIKLSYSQIKKLIQCV